MEEFIDFYELLQISPNAEPETVQRVFRMLAARYHPDNPHTGSSAKFVRLNEAYEVLSDARARAVYDAEYQSRSAKPIEIFKLREFAEGIEGETNRRMGILCLLYNRCRTNPECPGMSSLDLERLMSMPREHLMFTLWYLREKDWLRQTDTSDFVVTATGVDEVEKSLPKHHVLYKLLKAADEELPESTI